MLVQPSSHLYLHFQVELHHGVAEGVLGLLHFGASRLEQDVSGCRADLAQAGMSMLCRHIHTAHILAFISAHSSFVWFGVTKPWKWIGVDLSWQQNV